MLLLTLAVLILTSISLSHGQMSTDPRICGGYQRETRGFLEFKFDEKSAPPGSAMRKKFCMWTISPTVPSEQYRYNMTIRNVNLNFNEGDRITINYFNEESTQVILNEEWNDPTGNPTRNPIAELEPHHVWERHNVNGTTMIVILYVENIEYDKGFYLEWSEGYNSRLPSYRTRSTYYSFGKPSVAPNPYFAWGFRQNEIATFAFVKGNYTEGYVMDMNFWEIRVCEGQNDWMECFDDTFTIFQIENNATLTQVEQYTTNRTDTPVLRSRNGFFVIVKIEDAFGAGGRFKMYYDTVRG